MKKFCVLAAALILAALPTMPAAATPVEDTSTTTPIKHVVWMMQDNHSFDNYFGTYPGADGIPSGVCQRLSLNRPSTKGCVQPFHIGDTPVEDLAQGPGVQRRQHNGGRMDGFVAAYRRLGQDGTTAMGYYDGSDLPLHWNVADQYVLFDRFFASTSVGRREPYLYWVAGNAPVGQTPLRNSGGYNALPTIFDRLAERDIPARFYVENLDKSATRSGSSAASSQSIKVPLLSMKRFLDDGRLAGRVVDLSQYYVDLRNGTLPAVSYIVTTSSSENPPAGPEAGSRTLRKVTGELMKSSAWPTSAFMWTYDGWGGWYDHVPPPKVDSRGYGFRVPALLVSPYAKRGVVDHTVLDYTAMLHFIESNWSVKPLSSRDKQSAGLASAFDFSAAPRPATFLPWVWPAPQPAAATNNPAPVIYSVYGVGAALAIAMVGMAIFRRGPITVPVPVVRAGVLVRGRLDAVRDRIDGFFWGGRYSPTLAASAPVTAHNRDAREHRASLATSDVVTLTVPLWPRPAAGTNGQDGIAESYPATKENPADNSDGEALESATADPVDGQYTDHSEVSPDRGVRDSALQPESEAGLETEPDAATVSQTATELDADTAEQSAVELDDQEPAAAEAEPCPNCGAELGGQRDAFCEACGSPLPSTETTEVTREIEVAAVPAASTELHRRSKRRRNPNRRHHRRGR
jgi:phospholipase C